MKVLGYNLHCSLMSIIVFLVLGAIVGANLLCSCAQIKVVKEGMANLGASMSGDNNGWIAKADEYAAAMGNDNRSAFETNVGGTVPLPKGQLDYFFDTPVKPECCIKGNVGMYSTSTGCPCMSKEQVAYLYQRGGNNAYGSDM